MFRSSRRNNLAIAKRKHNLSPKLIIQLLFVAAFCQSACGIIDSFCFNVHWLREALSECYCHLHFCTFNFICVSRKELSFFSFSSGSVASTKAKVDRIPPKRTQLFFFEECPLTPCLFFASIYVDIESWAR